VREDLLGNEAAYTPKVMSLKKMADADSMLNTPNCFGIYMAGLNFEWIKKQGGVAAIEKVNIEKAKLLYDFLDESQLFKGTAQAKSRSRMNVTFVTGDPDKDAAFVKEAAAHGLVNLKGHRIVGGMRASIYNAMPVEGVRALVDFMKEFETKNK
jgi:phosphoserine aminotransferase